MGGRPGCQRSKQVVLTHSQVKALTRSHPSTPQRTTLHHSMLHARTPVQLAAVSAGPTCLASCGRAATYSFTVSQLSATKPAGGEACVCVRVSAAVVWRAVRTAGQPSTCSGMHAPRSGLPPVIMACRPTQCCTPGCVASLPLVPLAAAPPPLAAASQGRMAKPAAELLVEALGTMPCATQRMNC